MVQNGDIFWVAKFSNIFWGARNSDIFGGQRVDAGPEPKYAGKLRVPSPLGLLVPAVKCSLDHREKFRAGQISLELFARRN